jgi:hypothetical protein
MICASFSNGTDPFSPPWRSRTARLVVFFFCLSALSFPGALAQDAERLGQAQLHLDQKRLAEAIRQRPTDYDATYRFVFVSTELRDYEAAIGALERLLTFNPRLSRARKELGLLYARLGAYELATLHLRRAIADGGLDSAQVAQIEAVLPDIEKQGRISRWYGRLWVGLRSQSNANFYPTNDLFSLGGVDRFAPPQRRSDFNAFELGELAHDFDFQNQRGDRFETRLSGYSTVQFHLSQYNIALVSASAGPRLALAPDVLPGVTVKPYATGVVSTLGGTDYLNAGGFGVTADAPIGPLFSLEPGVEWRALYVNSGGVWDSTVASLASGDTITASVTGVLKPANDVKIETRIFYTRADAHNSVQSFNQIQGQALARFDFDAPFDTIARKWSIAPYGRIFQVQYDAPNVLVDAFRARRDLGFSTGLALEAPFTANLGIASSIEFSHNASNLPNYSSRNLSVMFGPAAKF